MLIAIVDDNVWHEFEKIIEARITRLDEPVHLGSFGSQQLREVAAVLPSDSRDQGSSLTHALCFIFCSAKSDSTIISTSCAKSTCGFQPSFS